MHISVSSKQWKKWFLWWKSVNLILMVWRHCFSDYHCTLDSLTEKKEWKGIPSSPAASLHLIKYLPQGFIKPIPIIIPSIFDTFWWTLAPFISFANPDCNLLLCAVLADNVRNVGCCWWIVSIGARGGRGTSDGPMSVSEWIVERDLAVWRHILVLKSVMSILLLYYYTQQ